MKLMRSAESVQLRRGLAQLIRRLRAIRKEQLSHEELATRLNLALSEARSISQPATFGDANAARSGATDHNDRHPRQAERARLASDTLSSHGALVADCA